MIMVIPEQKYDYELLFRLSCIEGELLGLRSEYHSASYISHVVFVLGYDFGWRGLRHEPCSSPACREVATAILQLVAKLDPKEWTAGIAQGEYEYSVYAAEEINRHC